MSKSNFQLTSFERTFAELVLVVHAKITKKIREKYAHLMTNIFEKIIKFFFHIFSNRKLIEC